MNGFEPEPVPPEANALAGAGALTLFVVLRAFSSGCAAMTGVEAISDGVPAFKPPEWKNARTTLTVMISILAVTFAGITFLAHQFGTYPMEASQAGLRDGRLPDRPPYLRRRQPRPTTTSSSRRWRSWCSPPTPPSPTSRVLSYFLARDRYMPRQFTFRGDRLAFTTGIVTLGMLASVVLADLQRRSRRPDPALRRRRLHLVHDLPVRHVHALAEAPRAGLASGPDHQPHRRDARPRSWPSSSRSANSGPAPGSS